MKEKFLLIILGAILAVALLIPVSCTHTSSVDVMAGTSHILNIIQDVAGGKLEVRTVIPPGMCPGHYDVKPSDIEVLAESKALIIHNYQEEKKNITGLVEAAKNPELIIKVIDIKGNWMAPPVQAGAVSRIAQALGEIYPEDSAYYQQRAELRSEAILAKGEEVKARLQQAELSEVKVICAAMPAGFGFVKWAGFDVVATYGRPEDLSVAEMENLVNQAKQAGVALVIDNLQSGGTTMSETMARDIEAIQVTISNFPGGFKGTETWEKAIDKNVALLLEALREWRE